MSDRGATVASPGILPAIGIALAVCLVALGRARASALSTDAQSRHQRRRDAKDLTRKRPIGTQTEVCEGLVDLIRDLDAPPEEQIVGPCMTRSELARGRLVVVVIGPASTKIHQSYVVNKLLRYLRWSNLVRRHFPIVGQDAVIDDSDSVHDLTDSEDSPTEMGVGELPRNGIGGGVSGRGCNGSAAAGGGHRAHGYTFSDRGKTAALATIAVQESAKKVASWLNALEGGGVAVIEAGKSGWASTRQGRAALPGFLRQATNPSLGILWVELLPSGLSRVTEGSASSRSGGGASGSRGSGGGGSRNGGGGGGGGNGGGWKSDNGLPSVPQGPGGNVVDTFLRSGNLVGAGGHVFYESVRRDEAASVEGGLGGGSRGGARGARRTCFVSLADQGAELRSQLRDVACPLVRRVGTFASALKIKKSWHDCPVYLTRHGESVMNQTKSMGGDARLSPTGDRYAGILAGFISAQPDAGQSRLSVWCSPMNRAAQTARAIKCHRYVQWQALTELDTGVFNGFTYKQVETKYPEEFTAREKDKLAYTYPEGESYLDVSNRLDSVVVAIERQDNPVIIISHQAVLRCLYAYFLDVPLRHMPHLPIALHTVVKLTPNDFHPGEGSSSSFWKELRFGLIKPTPLEQLVSSATTIKGAKGRKASQLGESLS